MFKSNAHCGFTRNGRSRSLRSKHNSVSLIPNASQLSFCKSNQPNKERCRSCQRRNRGMRSCSFCGKRASNFPYLSCGSSSPHSIKSNRTRRGYQSLRKPSRPCPQHAINLTLRRKRLPGSMSLFASLAVCQLTPSNALSTPTRLGCSIRADTIPCFSGEVPKCYTAGHENFRPLGASVRSSYRNCFC